MKGQTLSKSLENINKHNVNTARPLPTLPSMCCFYVFVLTNVFKLFDYIKNIVCYNTRTPRLSIFFKFQI